MPIQESVLVKGRFDQQLYSIANRDYDKIMELVRNYHESIYNLPDDERVSARPLWEDSPGQQCTLRVNEVVFV